MKRLLVAATLLFSTHCFAQQNLAFPFQGGNKAMMQFFKDTLQITPEIKQAKATGLVIFKFSADDKGNIKNVVIYYADDAILAGPVVEALKKSDHKWIIPDNEKLHDFLFPVLIKLNATDDDNAETRNALHHFYAKRKPILTKDQVPLNLTTLLPEVVVTYNP
ncbi:MAG TPA: hypothetical protein VHS53_11405 [Mucilaginibacter sp.]|jgi:hypothetical protein|nr:hypothetical protein [Mucilaginibacter sp.]